MVDGVCWVMGEGWWARDAVVCMVDGGWCMADDERWVVHDN